MPDLKPKDNLINELIVELIPNIAEKSFLIGAWKRTRTLNLRVTNALHYHCATQAYSAF
jgi:hypothetical protein